jgi:hypothetical protein
MPEGDRAAMAKELSGEHPWIRQEWESQPAYDAFRAYQRLRNSNLVCEEIGKSRSLVTKWCAENLWVERVRHMDNHVATSEVDSYAEELARVKNKHMTLADKLLDHLETLLNGFIARGVDPSVRWTQAFIAATKAQEVALKMRPMEANQTARLEDLQRRLAEIVEG